MPGQDKTLTCIECHQPFVFTINEQDFFAARGFTNDPKRCPACRARRRAASDAGERPVYPAVCAACGQETTILFPPTADRPVYCTPCFQARRQR